MKRQLQMVSSGGTAVLRGSCVHDNSKVRGELKIRNLNATALNLVSPFSSWIKLSLYQLFKRSL